MRFVRLLGIVIIFYGLSYAQSAIVQIFEAFRTSRNLNWYVVATNLNLGLVIFVVGIGLLLAKEWARILWLMSSIALLAIHLFLLWLVNTYGGNQTQQLLNTLLIIILLLISWVKLTRAAVKELFH